MNHSSTLPQFLAGSIAGVITTTVLHPLDSIKVRLQANEEKRKRGISQFRIFSALNNITKKEGLRSLYLGLTPAIIANGASWGLYFYFYEISKSFLSSYHIAGTSNNLLSGILGGMFTVTLTNPIWLLKTRMQLEQYQERIYIGFIPSIKRILLDEGISGLYRGIGPAYFLTLNGAVQFAVYEKLKQLNSNRKNKSQVKEEEGKTQEYILIGGISKVIATVTTYPAQVVKTRMQQKNPSPAYSRIFQSLNKIFKTEGISGFYKGLGANLVRVAPQSAIMFAVYENAFYFLTKSSSNLGNRSKSSEMS